MPEIADYQEWLASAIGDRAILECIEISHSAFAKVRLAKWQEDVTVLHEDGASKLYKAADFKVEPAEVDDTTEQKIQGIISALDGKLYNKIADLTPAERNNPMTITYRLYFADDPIQPLISPPPVWNVLAVQADMDHVTADMAAMPLRTSSVGSYYTLANFPILKYA